MKSPLATLDRFLARRLLDRWTTAAQSAPLDELSLLRDRRDAARRLRGQLDRLLFVAEDRLAMPRIGSNSFPKPPGTLWSWRPPLWRGPVSPAAFAGVISGQVIGPSVKVFHDCTRSEMTFRQIRNTRDDDLAAYGLQLDTLGFDGSFLSVAIDLTDDARDGLRKRDILQLHMLAEAERPTTLFARLNIKCGPNTGQVVQELKVTKGDVTADFDLAYADFTESRIDGLWFDLIVDTPAMNRIRWLDLTVCRYPRAEI